MSAVLLQDLTRRLTRASRDELRVIDRLLGRLELGRDRYGVLTLPAPRDWRRDFGEELLDAIIYDTIETLQAETVARENTQAAAVEELVELAHWQANDQRTRVSDESAEIAMKDIDDREPYEDWDVSDVHGGEGG